MLEANYVGWSSHTIQHQAFEIATNFLWLNWLEVESLLDVGCGYGRLLDVLISKKSYRGKYSGIDIIPEFIEKAIEIHDNKGEDRKPEVLVGDFLEQSFENEKFMDLT